MTEQSWLTSAPSDAQAELGNSLSAAFVRSTAGAAVHAEPIALHRKATSTQALVLLAGSCLRQIAQNQKGVREGFGDAVHQMRIGVRRLRAAISIFKDALRRGSFDGLNSELVWLTEQLAAVREYDVLIASKRNFDDFTRSAFAGECELADVLARRRQAALAVARSAVESARFHRFILSLTLGLILPADEDGVGDRLVRDLAREVLERRTRKVLRRLARFNRLGLRERHQLRIQVKKLRYGTQFFATLFPNTERSCKRFSRALVELQDTLGRLNDTTVHERIASDLVDGGTSEARASRRVAFAMGAFTEAEKAEVPELTARVERLAARLARVPRFWR